MVSIAFGSDIHLEFFEDPLGQLKKYIIPAEILILAGDIFNVIDTEMTNQIVQYLCEQYKEILYVPGNHDFYGTSIQTGYAFIKALEESYENFHALTEGQIFKYNNLTFIGGTMWWTPRGDNYFFRHLINDFKYITDVDYQSEQAHNTFIKSLKENCNNNTIVISHHLPHPYSIASCFSNDTSNRFFVSDQSQLIDELQPQLWFHGHTHFFFDYKVNDNTRILCNPGGYEHERDPLYQFRILEL